MSVFRVEKNKNFTVMSNYHLKDTNLSLKAKGLLSLMLSLPDNWDYTIKGLATICKDGVDSIKATVKELEKNGYIIRKRVRNKKGHLTCMEYIIYEEPKQNKVSKSGEKQEECSKDDLESSAELKRSKPLLEESKEELPKVEKALLEKPEVVAPKMEKPILEKPAQLNTNKSSTYELNTNLSNPNQSNEYECYLEIIKFNIDYEFLCDNHKSSKDMIDEIVDIIVETICSTKDSIAISGDKFPKEVVKSKFLKITQSHMEYILDCLSKNTTKIGNIKSYIRACIFNAPSTISSYYCTTVNSDLYGG